MGRGFVSALVLDVWSFVSGKVGSFALNVFAALLFAATPALAQTAAAPEPYRNIDENGVDLATGSFNFSMADVAGNAGGVGLALTRHWNRAGWTDNVSGTLRRDGNWITITRGSTSEGFSLSGSSWTAVKGNGATLTSSGTAGFPTYAYRGADGTTITFNTVGTGVLATGDVTPLEYSVTGATGSCSLPEQLWPGLAQNAIIHCAYPVSIARVGAEQINLIWQQEANCEPAVVGIQNGFSCNVYYRLQGMTDSSAYAVDVRYSDTALALGEAWLKRTGAKLVDRSVEHCDLGAGPGGSNDCTTSQPWPSASYQEPTNGTQQVTDSTGRTWTFAFANGRMTAITRPGASAPTTTISYDAQGRVDSITKDGVTKTYTWSTVAGDTVVATSGGPGGAGNVVTDPAVGRPEAVTAAAQTVQRLYDGQGRLTRETAPEGNRIDYERDGRGNIKKTILTPKQDLALPGAIPLPIEESADFDETCANPLTCNQPNFTIDAMGKRTDFTYDPATGVLTQVKLPAPGANAASTAATGANDVRPQVDYGYAQLQAQAKDASGALVPAGPLQAKLTTITTCATAATCPGTAAETKVTIQYNTPNLQPTAVTVKAGDNSLLATTTYAYDARDNLAVVDGPEPGSDDTTHSFYDAADRPVGTIGPDPDGPSIAGGAGNKPRPASRVTYAPATAAAAGLVIKAESGTAAGTSQSHLDAMIVLQTLEMDYDAAQRRVQERVKGSDGTVLSLTQFSYDAFGRPDCTALRMDPGSWSALPASACTHTVRVAGSPIGPDRITKQIYDPAGRVLATLSAYGTPDEASEGTVAYTPNGQIDYVTDARSNRTDYSYDRFDRLSRTTYSVAAAHAAAVNLTDYEELSYDAAGRVLSRRTRRGELLQFAYDALGRLVQKQVPERTAGPDALAATHTRDVFYGYDLKGRPVHARFDSHTGEGLAFAYDALDRIISTTQDLDGAADGPPRTLGYGYDATGQLERITHPDGQYLRYVNDRLGRTSEVWRDTTHKLVAWVYNKPGQLTQKRNGTTTDFAYLPDGRFASLTLNAAGTSQDNVLSATFNAAGQIASRTQSNNDYAFTDSGNFDHGYASNGLNQYIAVQGITHSYDANGNLTGDGTNTWVYDVENRLVSARGIYAANLRYDPLGRLHETVTNVDDTIPANDVTVRRLYDGGALVAEYDQTGTLLRRFVHGPNTGADTPLVWYEGPTMSQAAARMLSTDLQGSVTSVTDFNGNPIAINRYDEYGRPQSGNTGRFQYTGQAWLPEIGLYYYKARMYSPTLGRFMQTDPIGYADGVNWYNYVGGDPVNGVDPTGLVGDFICRRIVSGYRDTWASADGPVEGPSHETGRDYSCTSDSGDRWQVFDRVATWLGAGLKYLVERPIDKPNLCDRRNWHNLKAAERVAHLRAAGFLVATNVSLRLIGPNGEGYNGPGRAVADYIAYRPSATVRVFHIGEVKTGDGSLTVRQVQHYGTGFAQVLGVKGTPVGLSPGEIFPVVWTGVDRFPGCPSQ